MYYVSLETFQLYVIKQEAPRRWNISFSKVRKSQGQRVVTLKAIDWNRLVLKIYSCMMMKSCLFVSLDRSVTPFKRAFKVGSHN